MSQILVLCLEVPFLQSLSFNLGYSASDLRAPTASESSEASVIMQIMVHPGQKSDSGLQWDWLIFTFEGCEGIWNTYSHARL